MAALAASASVAKNMAAPPVLHARPAPPNLNHSLSISRSRAAAGSLLRRPVPALQRHSTRWRGLGGARAVAATGVLDVEAPPLEAAPAPATVPGEGGESTFFSGIVDSTKSILSDAVDAVADAADAAADAVDGIVDSIQETSEALVDSVKESSGALVDSVKESGEALVDKVKAAAPAQAPKFAADIVEETSPVPPVLPVEAEGLEAPSFEDALDSIELPSGADSLNAAPDVVVPSVPKFQLNFQKPEFALPQFKTPELPEFQAPEFKAPEFKAPEFTLPAFKKPDFNLPEFSKPEFSLPEFNKPEFSLPELTKPEFTLPQFKLPELTDIQDALKTKLSEIELPDAIKSKLPELPELPKLPEPPKLELPSSSSLPRPKLSLPPAVTEPVKAAVDQAAAQAQEQAAVAGALLLEKGAVVYQGLREQVPEEYQPYLQKVETNLESFWEAAVPFSKNAGEQISKYSVDLVRSAFSAAGYEADDALVSSVIVSVGTATAIVFWYRTVYGGYSGDLTPEEALKLLKENNAALLDLRPESQRDAEGIPDLRRGARFKDKSLQFEKYSGSLRSQLRSPDAVDLQLFSATVKGLKGVSGATSVIVMDEAGSNQAKEIARGLVKYGFQRSYVLSGGFRSWEESGQLVKANEPEPIGQIITNEFETFLEEVKPTPEGVITALVGTGVGVYALLEWENSLKIIALALAAQIIYSRAKTYETAADLQRDIRIITAPVWLTASLVSWIYGLTSGSSSKSPQLATATAGAEGGASSEEGASETTEGVPALAATAATASTLPLPSEVGDREEADGDAPAPELQQGEPRESGERQAVEAVEASVATSNGSVSAVEVSEELVEEETAPEPEAAPAQESQEQLSPASAASSGGTQDQPKA